MFPVIIQTDKQTKKKKKRVKAAEIKKGVAAAD